MLRVLVLGELELERDGEALPAPRGRRLRGLLGWLALHPGLHARGEVAGSLWPDVLDESARTSLRTALAELRRALGDGQLVATRDQVGLSPEVWVDARAFEALVREGRNEDALALVRGPLLDGLADDWVYEERDRQADRIREAVGRAADRAEDAGDLARAIARTREQIAVDRLAEDAHRALIRRLAASGDQAAALAAYANLRELLRRELAIEPSERTRALADEIRGAEPAPPLPPPLARRHRSPFVGREALLARLEAAFREVAGEGARSGGGAGGRVTGPAGAAWSAGGAGGGVMGPASVARSGAGGGVTRPRGVARSGAGGGLTRPRGAARSGAGGGVTRPRDAARSGGGLGGGAAAPASASRLVVLTGDAGIGKTRLAAELARAVHARGAAVLYGRADEEAIAPYQPLAEALPVLAAPPEPGAGATRDPAGERYRLFEAAARGLAGVAAQRPLLLVLDDLHWADRPTLLLLRHVARAPLGPLLILGTARADEPAPALDALLADLRRDGLAERVALEGLAQSDVDALVTAWLGSDAPTPLTGSVWSETGGNPFFVEEVLRQVWESGDAGVPEGVSEMLAARLARLGEPAGDVLRLAAVAGHARLDVLERASASPRGALVEALDAALAAHLLREESGRLAFAHALVREAIYARLSGARRALLHACVAEALEDVGGEDAELAHHFALAGGPAAKVVEHSARAGRAAAARLAYEEAARHFERALEYDAPERGADPEVVRSAECGAATHGADKEVVRPAEYDAATRGADEEVGRPAEYGAAARGADEEVVRPAEYGAAARGADAEVARRGGDRRAELLLGLGDAHLRMGEVEASQADFSAAAAAARGCGDSAAFAHAALGRSGLTSTVLGHDPETVSLLEEALQSIDEPALRARLLGRLAIELYHSPPVARREELSAQAVELARAAAAPDALADALSARHVALWSAPHLEERLAIADEMVALAGQTGDRERELQGRNWRVLDLLERGDVDGARREISAHERLADQLRLPGYQWWAPMWRAMLALLDGRIEDAERLRAEAVELGRRASDRVAELFNWIQAVFTDIEREPLPPATSTDVPDRLAVTAVETAFRSDLPVIYAEMGRTEEALQELEAIGADRFAGVATDMNWLASLAELGDGAALLGATDRAAELYELLAPYSGRAVLVGRAAICLGPVDLHLAALATALGRHDDAATHLDKAAEWCDAAGARLWAVWSEVHRADLLARRGEDGGALAAETAAAAERLGLGRAAARARAVAA